MTEPISTFKAVVNSVLPSDPEPNSPAEAEAQHTLAQGGETDHGIPLQGKRAEIMRETLNLYQLNPSLDFLKNVWIPETGIFEDGVCFAQGFEEYAPQCEWEQQVRQLLGERNLLDDRGSLRRVRHGQNLQQERNARVEGTSQRGGARRAAASPTLQPTTLTYFIHHLPRSPRTSLA